MNSVHDAADGGWVGHHMVDMVKNALLAIQSTVENADKAEPAAPDLEEESSSDDS